MEKSVKKTTNNSVNKFQIPGKILFQISILGPILYVLNVLLGGLITPKYSHIRDAVSQLTQRGAPNSLLLSSIFVVSASLILILGLATVMRYKGLNRKMLIGGVLIILYGVFAALLASVFPQDPIGSNATIPGTMHLILAGVTAFITMGAILITGLAKHENFQEWRHFKSHSIISVSLVFVLGLSTPILMINNIELMGLFERLTQIAYLQWFVVFAIKSYMGRIEEK